MNRSLRHHRAGGAIEKRSVVLDGHRTSVSLEPAFWRALKDIAARRGDSLNRLVARVDRDHGVSGGRNLSSALRVFVLEEMRGGDYGGQGVTDDSRSST